MADQSDVESALVSAISSALYPYGMDETSVSGQDCRIYRGWPNSAALDADLAAGKINVTVFMAGGTGRTTTRYAEQWIGPPVQPSLTAVVTGTSATFVGQAGIGQIAGILADGRSYAYRTQHGDTAELVAANLADMARVHSIVRLSHSTLTIAGVSSLLVRVVADAPASRDAATAAIDQSLSGVRFLLLPDGTHGRLIYSGTTVFDQSQNASLYRRDLMYSVEYATTLSASLPAMLFGNLMVNAAHFTA
jgi:hypothetical protein